MLFISKEFAHGFLILEDETESYNKCTDFYYLEFDLGIIWNDKNINIDWNLMKYNLKIKDIILFEKDKKQ